MHTFYFLASEEMGHITLSLKDLVYFGVVLTMVIGAVVEARVRVHLMGRRMDKSERMHTECSKAQQAHWEEIKDMFAKIEKRQALTSQRLKFLVRSTNGGNVPSELNEDE